MTCSVLCTCPVHICNLCVCLHYFFGKTIHFSPAAQYNNANFFFCHANFCTCQHLVSVYLTQRALAAIGYGHRSGGLVRSAKPVRVLIFDPEKLDFPFQSLVFRTTLPKFCSVHKTRAEAKTLECRSDISHRHLDTCLVTIRNFHLCAKCQKRVFTFTKARLDRRHYEVRSQYKQ